MYRFAPNIYEILDTLSLEMKEELLEYLKADIAAAKAAPKKSYLEEQWAEIKRLIEKLKYEPYIDDQFEIEEIWDICEEMIKSGKLKKESWQVRRRVLKSIRLDKIVIAAMKQSHKAWKPVIGELTPFKRFIEQPLEGRKFIAHCYEEIPRTYLFDELRQPESGDVTVLVGPEGDFSIDEVRMAIDAGYESVHLGESRLRTETAGLAAVMMAQLAQK